MRVFVSVCMVAAALLVAACGPGAKKHLVKQLDEEFKKSSDRRIAATARFRRPLAFAKGQYVVHRLTDKKGRRSISRMAIIGREDDGWIIEFYSLSESSEGVTQMLISGLDPATRSADGFDVKWVKVKDDKGQISTIDGPMLQFTKGMYKKMAANMNVEVTTFTSGGPVTVPAGVFANTLKFTSDVQYMGKKVRSEGWYHSGVPISGLVKSVSDDGNSTMELVDFGLRGAVSALNAD